MFDSCPLGAAIYRTPQTRTGLSRAGVRSLRMAFHLDGLSDTLVVNYQGDTVNHAFMLDCYVVFFPECQDVERTCLELEAVPGVVYAEPNGGAILRDRP